MSENRLTGSKEARRNWLAALLLRRQGQLMPRFVAALTRMGRAPRRTRRRWRGALAGAALVLAMTASPLLVPRAHAATITVANGEIDVNDNGLCSLIEAVINAENEAQTHDDCAAGSGADTLDLPAGGTFTFTASYVTDDGDNGLPTIDTTITIDGNGSTLDLGGAAVGIRLAKVGSTGDLMLTDATVSNGYLSSPYSGGTFHVDGGALTVEDATLTNSEAGFFGGAIYAASGATVNLQSGTTISGSYAFRGGGLYADGDSDVTLYEALITDNSVDGIGAGAGLFVDGGTLTIGDSRITDNTGGFYGGGPGGLRRRPEHQPHHRCRQLHHGQRRRAKCRR